MLGQKAGCYLATKLLCEELSQLGLRVVVFAQNVDFGGDSPPTSFEIVRPWLQRGCRWEWPTRSLAWRARRRIITQRPDYTFIMGVGPLSRLLLRSNIADRLLIWELTNATPGNKFADAEAACFLGRCRAMLSPSVVIDHGIRDTYKYNGPILRLPFWIEDRRDAGAHVDAHGSTRSADFIFLGRRDKEKGLSELVNATAQVAERFPGVRVLITGQGSEEPFVSQARNLGVTQNVIFRFFPRREETMQALADARCLVLPSYHEGYPLVLLEAIRAGVPIIATAVGSVPAVFADSESALLVSPKDAAALAQAMQTILSESPGRYEKRRIAACELFRKLNSAEAITARLKSLLRQVDALPKNPADEFRKSSSPHD